MYPSEPSAPHNHEDGISRRHILDAIEKVEKKVDTIHECIYGNGKPAEGMATRLSLVEAFVKRAEKLMWIAVGAAVTSGIGLVITVVTNLK